MHEHCPQQFDETLLSGYLDRELTQATEQKVRIHLEDCPVCRHTFAELTKLRETTMTTRFVEPSDEQWNEAPKSWSSLGARTLGWTIGIIWFVLTACFALWQLWHSPHSILEKVLVFSGVCALVLLLVSVLLDRLRSLQYDPYREVEK